MYIFQKRKNKLSIIIIIIINDRNGNKTQMQQECIPVGCVSTAAVATTRYQYPLDTDPPAQRPPEQTPPWRETLQTEHETRQEVTSYTPSPERTSGQTVSDIMHPHPLWSVKNGFCTHSLCQCQ